MSQTFKITFLKEKCFLLKQSVPPFCLMCRIRNPFQLNHLRARRSHITVCYYPSGSMETVSVQLSFMTYMLWFSRETEPIYLEKICYRNWLPQLWRLTSPKICSQRTGDLETQESRWWTRGADGAVLVLRTTDPGGTDVLVESKGRRKLMSQLKGSQQEFPLTHRRVSHLFYSGLQLTGETPTLERE